MIVIGLTGQTGAGKTTVAQMLGKLGCGIVNADAVAREALAPGSECLSRLAERFGKDIILENGEADRKLIASRAFADSGSTRALGEITHPWIIRRTEEYLSELRNNNYEAAVFDAPQLFESGGDRLCDVIIAVTAPEETRLDRIMQRDGIGESAARLRMSAQHGEDFFRSRADFVINGGMPRRDVRAAAAEIYKRVIKKDQATGG